MLLDLLADACASPSRFRFLPADADGRSVGEIWTASARAGAYLRSRTRTGTVAMLLESSFDCLAALVGGWRGGLTVASLPHPSRGVPIEEYRSQVETMCRMSSADVVVAEDERLGGLAGVGPTVLSYREVQAGSGGQVDVGTPAFVQFTSGSTSRPKGVVLSLDALAANVRSQVETIEPPPGTVAVSWLPLSHDMGLVGMCLATWCACGSAWAGKGEIVLIRPETFLANPAIWLKTCSRFGAFATTAPNFALELATRTIDRDPSLDLSNLRVCIVGSEPVRADTLRRLAKAAVPYGLDERAFCPAYGMAEASLAVTIVPPDEQWSSVGVNVDALAEDRWELDESERSVELVSCGRPIPNMAVGTKDDATVGELRVAGPSLFSRYVGGDGSEVTDGWFDTSDVGHVGPGGEVYVIGRSDDVIVVSGRNLHAGDIEAVVTQFESVRRGNCGAVADGAGGFVVVAERARGFRDRRALEGGARQIRSEVARRFGAGPTAVLYVAPGVLPKTPSGKLRRSRLRRSYLAGELSSETAFEFGPGERRESDC